MQTRAQLVPFAANSEATYAHYGRGFSLYPASDVRFTMVMEYCTNIVVSEPDRRFKRIGGFPSPLHITSSARGTDDVRSFWGNIPFVYEQDGPDISSIL
jgi:hypothetical protein